MNVAVIYLMLVCFITFFRAQGDDNHVALKIHGGSTASPGMFPSIGYIVGSDGISSCGATLISTEWAITAAHCFTGLQPEDPVPVRVVFGEVDTSDITYRHQESCFEVTIHEDYNDDTLDNDIALIRLKKPVNITDFVKPVDISTTFAEETTFPTCLVAGWGATKLAVYPDELQFAEVTIQNASVCDTVVEMESTSVAQLAESSYEDLSFNEDMMICAGSDKSDACDGDSGGPLYCVDALSESRVLVGIVSSGQANCTPGLNGVYTRLSAYTQWIEQISAGESTIFSLSFLVFITYFGKLLSSI